MSGSMHSCCSLGHASGAVQAEHMAVLEGRSNAATCLSDCGNQAECLWEAAMRMQLQGAARRRPGLSMMQLHAICLDGRDWKHTPA